MKKLLTVVLCIAVIFTFSFSGAFAATGSGDYNKTTAGEYLKDALDQVDGDSADHYDGIWVKFDAGVCYTAVYDMDASGWDGFANGYYFISSDVLEANYEALLAETEDYYKATATNKVYVDTQKLLRDMLEDDANAADGTNCDDVALDLVRAQFAADKQDALDALDSVSYSAYSTEEMDDDCGHTVACETYKEHVQKIVSDAKSDVNGMKTSNSQTYAQMLANKVKIDTKYIGEYAGQENGTYVGTELLYEKGYNGVGLGTYELNKKYQDKEAGDYATKPDQGTKTYAELGEYLDSEVSGNDAVKEAKKASLKAALAASKAGYVKSYDSNAEVEYANNVQEAFNYLIDEGVITADTQWADFFENTSKSSYAGYASKAVKAAKELKDEAATLAAETDSNGTLVRDADDVADALEDGLTAIYKTVLNKDGEATYAGSTSEYDASKIASLCEADIAALYVSLDDSRLAYFKKWATTKLDREYADADDDGTYYAPEYAEYAKLVESYKATIESATKHSQVEKALEDFYDDLADIDDKADVKAEIDKTNLLSQTKEYADLLNNKETKDGKKFYLGHVNASTNDYEKLIDEVYRMVGATEARTKAEIEALDSEAFALVKTFPTNDAVDDLADALEDALDAVPKTVKISNADLVDAAITAYDAYKTATRCSNSSYKTTLANIVVKLAAAKNNELDDKYDALASTDKAGLEALQDEIDDFTDKYDDYATIDAFDTLSNKIDKDLDDIQSDALDDVKAAINKIPAKANITEASKSVVAAARAAYDKYVETYTDYDNYKFGLYADASNLAKYKYSTVRVPGTTWTFKLTSSAATTTSEIATDGYAADDLEDYYKTLTAAEALVGLNATTPEEAVKTLKITAKSVAKKGSITVTWKVVGDESAADGYQIWKSTKHSKGYKKAFTTAKKSYKNTKGLKKGVRYYYKVRAYKVVDGKNVYSDWSNKARRIAK